MFCDSLSVIFFSKNDKKSSNSKYIEIKYLVVGDKVKDGLIVIEHIDFDAKIADPLIEDLAPKIFYEHVITMAIVNSFDILG